MATVEIGTEIRPFQLGIQDEALEDLRRRIQATRLPSKELVEDRSQAMSADWSTRRHTSQRAVRRSTA
jgi:hypothetical protein